MDSDIHNNLKTENRTCAKIFVFPMQRTDYILSFVSSDHPVKKMQNYSKNNIF